MRARLRAVVSLFIISLTNIRVPIWHPARVTIWHPAPVCQSGTRLFISLCERFFEPQYVDRRLLAVGARITPRNPADKRYLFQLREVAVQAALAHAKLGANGLLTGEAAAIHGVVPAQLLEHGPERQRDAPYLTHPPDGFPAHLSASALRRAACR